MGGMPIDLVRKSIKNLHLAVYPPDGRIRVAAPWHVSDEAIRLAVATRVAWINRQRRRFLAQARQSKRDYVSGETHYFLGRGYRLRLNCGGSGFRFAIKGNLIVMTAPMSADREARERAMQRWYRRELRRRAEPQLAKWATRMEVDLPLLGIKRMRTKWGTCNPSGLRVWLNLELAKKPLRCIDYIIVHELAHLIERTHGERFVAILDRYLPHWSSIRDELNAAPLADEVWQTIG